VIGRFGDAVRPIAPQFVEPYVKSNKNNANDTEPNSETVSRPYMRSVPAKPVERQDIQSLHCVRSRLVSSRTQQAVSLTPVGLRRQKVSGGFIHNTKHSLLVRRHQRCSCKA
jgi:hypothetical protein